VSPARSDSEGKKLKRSYTEVCVSIPKTCSKPEILCGEEQALLSSRLSWSANTRAPHRLPVREGQGPKRVSPDRPLTSATSTTRFDGT